MNINKYIYILLIITVLFSCKRQTHTSPNDAGPSRLEQVMSSGTLKVVTDINSTSYFIYRGQPMGYQYELLQELADHLGVKLEVYANNDLEEKFHMLEDGDVDLIAMNLTITKERRARVDFTKPHAQTRQVLVQRKPENWQKLNDENFDKRTIRSQLDMAGKTIYVPKKSSFIKRLLSLSDEIGDSIHIVEVDETVEHLIEKVSEGEIEFTISDENVAMVNATYYNNIDISVPVSFPQNLAWAVAKGSDDLKSTIDQWLVQFKRTRKYSLLYKKYFRNSRTAEIVSSDYYANNSGKISPYDAVIKEYSAEIGWDWRLVASMIYQESRFNPRAKSIAGAYGLMQLMPATAERFGAHPSSSIKQQIKAGILFIQWLDEQFADIRDRDERQKFVLAAYNIGLGHILDARALASKNGRNSDIWYDSVDKFLLKKAYPAFYNDPVVRNGSCKGKETYRYVAEVIERYEQYKNLISR